MYQSQTGQDLTEYCFTKLSKLNKLQLALTDEQIIDVIIEGIGDTQVQLTLRAANCRIFVDFAAYIKNIPNTSHSKSTEMTCGTKRTKRAKINNHKLDKCFVDLGCQYTLIKQSVALKIGLTQTEIIKD
jgi:hypothetical protein